MLTNRRNPYALLLALLSIVAGLSGCYNVDTTRGEPFDIDPVATVRNSEGVMQLLSECIASDSTFVLRIKNDYPVKGRSIQLLKIREITDNYPPTNDIIILADELPENAKNQNLYYLAKKMRVFKIADSLLPETIEERECAYVFYLDKKLHASNVYLPDSMDGDKTYNYFKRLAIAMNREPTHIPRPFYRGKGTTIGRSRSSTLSFSSSSFSSGTGIYQQGQSVNVGSRRVNKGYYEDFYFKNTGSDPVTIYDVKNSWNRLGCKVEVPNEVIMPGSEGRIRVYYKVNGSGSFNNEVKVYTNQNGSYQTLNISGTATR